MKLLLQVLIILICIWIIIKGIKILGGLVKTIRAIFVVLISPIKRIIVWELKMIKVVFVNVFYPKHLIYLSLQNKDFVGVEYDIDLPKVRRNPIVVSICILAGQIYLLRIFCNYSFKGFTFLNMKLALRSYIIMNYEEIKLTIISIMVGILIGYMYHQSKRNKVKPTSNIFLKSSLGALVEPMKIKQLSNTQIHALLATHHQISNFRNFGSTRLNNKKISYPLLSEYWNELQTEKQTQKILWAFGEIVSFLYQNRNIKTAEIGVVMGDTNICINSLNITEYALSLFINDKLNKYEAKIKARLVFFSLAHEIGRAKIGDAESSSPECIARYSAEILGLMKNFAELDNNIRDDVIYLINNQFNTLDENNKELVIIHQLFLTAKTQTSRQYKDLINPNDLLAIYRDKIYGLLGQKDVLEVCGTWIQDNLYLSVELFLELLLKDTGQDLSTGSRNAALNNINMVFNKDLLVTKEFIKSKDNIYNIKFFNIRENKLVKHYRKCFVLNTKALGVGLLKIEQSLDIVAREADIGMVGTVENNEALTTHLPADNDKNYTLISLKELEEIFLEELRRDGFLIDKIEFQTQYFVRCNIKGMAFKAGTYKAFVKGVPNLRYTIFKSPNKNLQEDNVLLQKTFELKGYNYQNLENEFDEKSKLDNNQIIERIEEVL